MYIYKYIHICIYIYIHSSKFKVKYIYSYIYIHKGCGGGVWKRLVQLPIAGNVTHHTRLLGYGRILLTCKGVC